MNHIDEGTLHAYIDGAVDATRGREIEAHLSGCTECSAALAEARGLTAGASRILMSLDDVPAGVVPKRAPVPAAPRAPKRRWQAAKWVTGIAAALMLAVGVTTWNRRGAELATDVPRAKPAESAPAAPVTTPTPPAKLPEVVATKATPAPRTSAPGAVRVRAAENAPTKDEARFAERRDVASLADVKVGRAAAGAAAPASVPAREPSLENVGIAKGRVAEAPVDSLSAIAGCYRLEPVAVMKKAAALDAVGERTTAAAAQSRRASAAPSAAPAPAYNEASAVSMLVRLDTALRAPGFAVRDSRNTVVGFWAKQGDDSLRVTLAASGSFTVASKNRVACPQ